MKKITYLLFIILVIIGQSSCQKSTNKIVTNTDLLCAVTWKYQQYYINYNQNNTVLAYSIYKSNNLQDFSRNRMKYNTNGTFSEIDEKGTLTSGTWNFNSNESNIELHTSQNNPIKKLLVLNNTEYQWGSLDGNIVAIMISE